MTWEGGKKHSTGFCAALNKGQGMEFQVRRKTMAVCEKQKYTIEDK